MKRFLTLLLFCALSSPALAGGIGDRSGGIYAVLGLDRHLLTFTGESTHTDFSGFGLDAEAGVDLVSSNDFGLNLAAIFRQADGKNPSSRTDMLETSEATSYGGKAGIIFSALTFGAGYEMIDVKTKNVATAGGYSESRLSGNDVFAFVNLTFNIGQKYRSMVELAHGQGTVGGLEMKTTSITLKIGILGHLK